jgi:hypothetical protein
LMHWNHALYATGDGQYSSVVPGEQPPAHHDHVDVAADEIRKV